MQNRRFQITARATSAGTTFYTRNPQGNLLDEHGAGGTNFYLTNYQHSVMALVSPSGDYLNGYYLYSPYGVTTTYAQSGGSAAASNPWQYAGGYRDTLEGDNYYHFGARYYIPTNTRWTQADPKTGNINNPATLLTYGFAGDDPINRTDSAGRDPLDEAKAFVSGTLVEGGAELLDAGGLVVEEVGISELGTGAALAVGVGLAVPLLAAGVGSIAFGVALLNQTQ